MEEKPLENWEREVLAGHRWGPAGQDAAQSELARLRTLHNAAMPLNDNQRAVTAQVLGPEICNWALFATVARVCSIIGREVPDARGTGHSATLTGQRWRHIWSYYSACRNWLVEGRRPQSSYGSLLDMVDPQGEMRQHVEKLLGQRDRLKELFVERFCICLDAWLGGLPTKDQPERIALDAAAKAIEEEILKHEPQPRVPFEMIRLDDCSILQPCHHKLFRRYDIILSSIGDGQWRKSMPARRIDGEERAREIEPYLVAIENWIVADKPGQNLYPAADLYERLGSPNNFKRFAAALLASLLRCQQSAARLKAGQ